MFALRHKETHNLMCIDTQWDCFGSTVVFDEHADNIFVVHDRSVLQGLIDDFNTGNNELSNYPLILDTNSFAMYEIVELIVK